MSPQEETDKEAGPGSPQEEVEEEAEEEAGPGVSTGGG